MNKELPVYTIPEWNLSTLESKIEKMRKRAAKVGLSPVSLEIVSEEFIEDPRKSDADKRLLKFEGIPVPKIKVYKVTVSGAPKLEGWKFVGTLDHKTIPEKVIVNPVPNETVPSRYFEYDTTCEHCNKKRVRNETFVVENENGETKAVGRSCLKDFLGHNPAAIASYMEGLYALFKEIEGFEEYSGGGYYVPSYTVREYLNFVAPVIRIDGWVARSAAGAGRLPTTATVAYLMEPPFKATTKEMAAWKEAKVKYETTEEDMEVIEAAIEWVKNKPEDVNNSYMHNLKTMVDADYLTHKLFGYAASIVSSYLKEQDKLRLKEVEKETILNEYFGEVGTRYSFEGYVKKITYFDTQYGTSSVVTIQSKEGYQLVFFTTASFPDKGVKFTFDAMVKEHKEYNDFKQTILQRPTKIKELEVEEEEA